MSYELPDPHRDEDDCGCRSSATCARHLEEADLTLEHVPMGKQTEDAAADSSAGFVPAFASSNDREVGQVGAAWNCGGEAQAEGLIWVAALGLRGEQPNV